MNPKVLGPFSQAFLHHFSIVFFNILGEGFLDRLLGDLVAILAETWWFWGGPCRTRGDQKDPSVDHFGTIVGILGARRRS